MKDWRILGVEDYEKVAQQDRAECKDVCNATVMGLYNYKNVDKKKHKFNCENCLNSKIIHNYLAFVDNFSFPSLNENNLQITFGTFKNDII